MILIVEIHLPPRAHLAKRRLATAPEYHHIQNQSTMSYALYTYFLLMRDLQLVNHPEPTNERLLIVPQDTPVQRQS